MSNTIIQNYKKSDIELLENFITIREQAKAIEKVLAEYETKIKDKFSQGAYKTKKGDVVIGEQSRTTTDWKQIVVDSGIVVADKYIKETSYKTIKVV